ncbi:MAG TPA: ornithine cyclodeaminase family protein [Polyangia bacterium]|nr:ornithine cyclodeaminase family protein [Polyangia bacterium]
MTLLIREAEVEQLVTMPDVIEAVEASERALGEGRAIHHPRERVRLPGGMLHLMAGGLVDDDLFGFKAYTACGRGPVRFKVFLYHGQTGVLEAIVEGSRLGQMRTGAATAVAARRLARADAAVVGLIGTGFQAAGQLEALACVRRLREVRAFGRNPERRRAFCERLSAQIGVPVHPVDNARAAVTGADLVVTATTAREPVLEGAWLAPGAFVAAVGANLLVRREIDREVLARAAHLVVDSIEQARRESGALVLAADTGQVRWEQVAELRELAAGRRPGRTGPDEITLFHSLGSVVWDLSSAALVLARARTAGAGALLPME